MRLTNAQRKELYKWTHRNIIELETLTLPEMTKKANKDLDFDVSLSSVRVAYNATLGQKLLIHHLTDDVIIISLIPIEDKALSLIQDILETFDA